MVIAKLPHVREGQPPYSKPLAVTKVLGFFNYILEDGKKHNARHLKPGKQEDSPSTQEDTPATRPPLRNRGEADIGTTDECHNASIHAETKLGEGTDISDK